MVKIDEGAKGKQVRVPGVPLPRQLDDYVNGRMSHMRGIVGEKEYARYTRAMMKELKRAKL